MEFFSRYWTTIRAQLEGLSAQTRWLIGALAVILLLIGALAMLYAGAATMTPLSSFAAGQSDEVLARLRTAGIEAEVRNGQIFVPTSEVHLAVARMAQDNLLSDNAFRAFDELADSPWNSESVNNRAYLKAKMRVTSEVARRFDGVDTADVMIDPPPQRGFGSSSARPTGSITVRMRGGVPVNRATATALADLVSSSMAEMRREDVKVIDAATGRSIPIAGEGQHLPTDVLELVAAEEQRTREKIEHLLPALPGVVVAVKVDLDRTQVERVESVQYDPSQPLRRESSTERTMSNVATQGEAGVRPNAGMTIDGGNQGQTTAESETKVETEFDAKLPTSKSVRQIAGHGVKQVNVTINVPRRYFIGVFKQNNPTGAEAPTDADLQATVASEIAKWEEQVRTLLTETPSAVKAAMVYDAEMFQPVTAGGGVVGTILEGPAGNTLVVVALGGIAALLMFMMVRKATRQEPLPSVEELAGVPMTLPTDDELIGEANDVESTMPGVEVGEEELKSRKIAEQISDLIKTQPQEVGSLLGRWVDYAER